MAFFAEALARYHKQNQMAEGIIMKRPIGMLLVDAVHMKELLKPSPLRCLDVRQDYHDLNILSCIILPIFYF